MCHKTTKELHYKNMNYHLNILLNAETVFRTPELRIYAYLLLQEIIKYLKGFPEHNTTIKQYVVRNTVATVLWGRSYQSFLLAYNYTKLNNFYVPPIFCLFLNLK